VLFNKPDSRSAEDHTIISESESLVPASTITTLKAKVKKWISETEAGKILDENNFQDSRGNPLSALKICILDGFLLYSDSMSAIHQFMDMKYFLPVSCKISRARRESRPPYVLKDGSVWTDPPGYFEKIIWPNYVEEHGWMFGDGDVEGRVKRDVLGDKGIQVLSERTDGDMESTLGWAVECLIRDLTNLVAAE
jgi:nicotinamide/nicotinate riboside kinase